VQIVVHNGQHRGKVVVDRSDTTQFIVEDVDFNSVVTSGRDGALIYTTPDNDTEFPIRVADLLSDKGMLLSDQNSAMFEVSSVDFKATRLALARPTVGPNAYYTFDTVSGSAVTDDANGKHPGAMIGTPKGATAADLGIELRPNSAKANDILELNGTSQFMNVPTSADLQPGTTAFTFAGWVRVDDIGREQIIAGAQNQTGINDGWVIGLKKDASQTTRLFVQLGQKNTPNQTLTVVGGALLRSRPISGITWPSPGTAPAIRSPSVSVSMASVTIKPSPMTPCR